MKTSVVLSTYNGEAYIREQLNSILEQSRKPDELIIIDDASKDHTVDLVRKATENSGIEKVSIHQNSENVGWKANFMNGFHLAEGDIIFCADQDDIWLADKIKVMAGAMEENPGIEVLACNLKPLYEEGSRKLADFYIIDYGNERTVRVDFLKHGFTMLRPGCTMCFRRSLLESADQIWNDRLGHDEVIWAIGIVTEKLYIINECLIRFRRHENNNSPSNSKSIANRLLLAENDEIKINCLLSALSIPNDQIRQRLMEMRDFDRVRIEAFRSGRKKAALYLLKNIKAYGSIRSWTADMISVING